jgi:hypothetical protein
MIHISAHTQAKTTTDLPTGRVKEADAANGVVTTPGLSVFVEMFCVVDSSRFQRRQLYIYVYFHRIYNRRFSYISLYFHVVFARGTFRARYKNPVFPKLRGDQD